MEIADKVLEIERECLDGRMTPAKAASEINTAVGGIRRIEYKEGLKFKVDNSSSRIKLIFSGVPRKYLQRLGALAVAIYYQSKQNGNLFPGEVHLGPYASTKDHMEGIKQIYASLCFS